MNLNDHPHTRMNPLTGERVLVSSNRTGRPWNGKEEKVSVKSQPHYDPNCYLCPGNNRAGGIKNPQYTGTFVFTNDFAALMPLKSQESLQEQDLLVAQTETGTSRVICFSPRHDLTMGQMDKHSIMEIIRTWKEQYADLTMDPDIGYIQIFENRGENMGCSNPHPHGQIWATRSIPDLPLKEQNNQARWLEEKKTCLLCEYRLLEAKKQERIVFENQEWLALVPFWAVWPFETMILPKRHVGRITDLDSSQEESLADALRRMICRFDHLFEVNFPYSMGIHQAPADNLPHPEWHLHFHFLPPLLRSATVKKFMVGFEMLAMPQRDSSPEYSAQRLRDCSEEKLKQI